MMPVRCVDGGNIDNMDPFERPCVTYRVWPYEYQMVGCDLLLKRKLSRERYLPEYGEHERRVPWQLLTLPTSVNRCNIYAITTINPRFMRIVYPRAKRSIIPFYLPTQKPVNKESRPRTLPNGRP